MIDRRVAWGTPVLLIAALVAPRCATAVTPPSPPACTADGYCRPRPDWGYTEPKWRPWPGSQKKASDDADSKYYTRDLEPLKAPRPTEEDLLAPPNVDALDPESRGEEDTIDFPLPDRDEFERARDGANPGADDEGPQPRPAPPRVPNIFDNALPPFREGGDGLDLPIPPGQPPADSGGAFVPDPPKQRPVAAERPHAKRAQVRPSADQPPSFPFGRAMTAPTVQQATHHSAATRRTSPVQQAVAPKGDDPPELPAVFLQ